METPEIDINSVQGFKELIAFYKPVVYKTLKSYMPGSEASRFGEMVNSYTDRIGQYRRPSYLILWNMLYGGKTEESILPAAAQQCTEDYYLIFKIGKVLLKLVIGIIANSILGIIAIVLADYFLNLGISLSLKLLIPIAIFGLPGVGTIVLLKLLGVPV